MGAKINAGEMAAELCADLNAQVDVEELARATGLQGNTIFCFGYKNKGNYPNLMQLIKILDRAQELRPEAVRKFLKRLAARYEVWAEALEALRRELGRQE